MTAIVYLLRHGETSWNAEGRMQGHLDSALTARGEDQARAMGAALRDGVPNLAEFEIVASPLGRTKHTAELVATALDRPSDALRFDDRQKEITWGEWDGLTVAEIEARWPGEWRARADRRWGYQPPGGESYAMVGRRMAEWLDQLATDDRLIVVSHGAAGRVMRGLYAGLPKDEITTLAQPQDGYFRLAGGEVGEIQVGPL